MMLARVRSVRVLGNKLVLGVQGCLASPVLCSSEDRIIDIMRYEDKLDDFIIGRYAAFDVLVSRRAPSDS